ncbi:MAG: alpha/beta fold hydrolase [Planctomycetia bacterium]|nr:alpha/beta fold hydrolase [Planctomycetia bacterium]
MRTVRAFGIGALGGVIVAGLCAAALAAPAGGGLAAREQPDPVVAAQGYLKQARDWGTAAAKLAENHDPHAVDAFYAATEAAWNAVWTCPGSAEIVCEASELYVAALEGLLVTACHHGRFTNEGLALGPRWKTVVVPIETRALPVDASLIEKIVAVPPPADARIRRHHCREGFGLPVVVRVKRAPPGTVAGAFAPDRQSLAATAVLRFRMPGDETFLQTFAGPLARDHAAAVLDLANPVEIAAVRIGAARPPLAGDLTAPLLDVLEGTPQAGLSGFIQPYGRGDTQPRLEVLEPHQPGRIPVVFIHGLASDEGTWFDLLNELRTWPTFHRRYEPWVFHYPTGASFLQSAAVLRGQLQAAVHGLDPEGADPALRQVVLVGHSMGGLHAKMMVVEPGTAIWDSVSRRPFDEVRMQPEVRRFVAPLFFFEPLPFVKRVVFIATPHAGSSLASRAVGRAAALTVRRPAQTAAVYEQLVALNPDTFQGDFARSLPTTVDILEPESSILAALRALRTPCWVTTHSVIGTAHHSLTGDPGDCVVPASSARLAGTVSEIEVPATHTKVHHQPATVRELERILTQHLHETGP